MYMIKHLYNFIAVGIVMALIDVFYLSLMASFFGKLVYSIQNSKMELEYFSTFMVYIFLVLQLYYFVIMPYSKYTKEQLLSAFLLGLTTYGVFEFTNKAIFKKWTYEATLYDTLWGGILFTLTTYSYMNFVRPFLEV